MMDLRWINTGAFIVMLAVNALAELIPIGGKTTGQISTAYPNLFTPAPVTFSIWGLIYFLMLLFVVYQHGILDRRKKSSVIREKIGPWFAISCALNTLWIFLWHYQMIGLSTVCILMLLIALNVIATRLQDESSTILLNVAAKSGFSLYYGWIIAAAIANISVYLTRTGWNGWGISPDIWTVLILFVGAGIAIALTLMKKDWIAALAIMWAYIGILIRHISPSYDAGAHPYIIAAAIASEGLILGAIVIPKLLPCCRERTSISSGRENKSE